jgi:hypothetical protein
MVVVIVLASRGFKDLKHRTVTVSTRPVEARPERLEDAVARLEKQLDQVDRALDHSATQLDRQLDHSATQIERQVDHRTTEIVRQLEQTLAQIKRQVEHVGRQVQRRHREGKHHVVVVAQTQDDPPVIEPSPPALPVAMAPPVSTTPATPPAPPVPSAVARPSVPAVATTVASPSPNPKDPAAPPTNEPAVETEGEKLPEWAKTEIVDDGGRKLVVVPGGFAGSQKEAEHNALEAARLVVGDAIQHADPKVGTWLPSAESVRQVALLHTFVEKIHRKTVSTGTPFIVYRAYHQVELSPRVFDLLVANWKHEVLPGRLEALGGLVALLTLTFATGAAYFRLDDRTQGRYRGRLKLAAVAVIGAGAAAAAALI